MLKVYLILCFGFVLFLNSCGEKTGTGQIEQAVAFRLVDTDSTYRQLDEFKGKIIMLHFWADWCPHCRKEFPELENSYQDLKDKGFLIVGINSGQSFDHVIGIQEEFGLTFPMLIDEEAGVAKSYKVSGLPSSFFIDEEGTILETEVGWVTSDKIKTIFDRLSG